MKYVEIKKLQNDGTQLLLATCTLFDDELKIEGDQKFAQFVTEEGINNYSEDGSKKLFPKDGLLFLEQLQYNFKSGYLSAGPVQESN